MALADLLTSVVSGGATGLIGAGITRLAEHHAKKMEYKHDEKMRELDAAIMREEWTQKTKIADIEAEVKLDATAAASFAASFNEPQRYSDGTKLTAFQNLIMVFVDALRAVVRPALTIYLCAISTYLYWDAHKAMEYVGVMELTKLVNQIVDTILYLTTVVVAWWFGTRVKEKK